jgi:hypothetical protein
VARRQTAEPLVEEGWASVAASGSLSGTAGSRERVFMGLDENDVVGRYRAPDRPIIECSCSVQWKCAMRRNELGDSLGLEWAREVAGAPKVEER